MTESGTADSASAPPPAPSPFRPVTLPPQPMRISAVLGRTIRTWFGAVVPLLATAALVLLPFQLLRAWAFHELEVKGALAAVAQKFIELAEGVGELIPLPVLQALVTLFVFQRLRGERGELGRSMRLGSRRLLAIFGVILLRSLPIFVPLVTALNGASSLAPDPSNPGAALPTAGLLLVSGLVAFVFELLFCVSAPALLVERLSVLRALRRSAALTKGRRAAIFGAYMLLGLLSAVFSVPSLLLRPPPVPGSPTELLVHGATFVVTASLSAVFPVVLYHELRETKEGVGLDELAGVFD